VTLKSLSGKFKGVKMKKVSTFRVSHSPAKIVPALINAGYSDHIIWIFENPYNNKTFVEVNISTEVLQILKSIGVIDSPDGFENIDAIQFYG
jgi:hypothetical protein